MKIHHYDEECILTVTVDTTEIFTNEIDIISLYTVVYSYL